MLRELMGRGRTQRLMMRGIERIVERIDAVDACLDEQTVRLMMMMMIEVVVVMRRRRRLIQRAALERMPIAAAHRVQMMR